MTYDEADSTESAGLLDARAVLAFTARLHAVRGRVEDAAVSEEQRHRWHRRLAAISEGAAADLSRAAAQLGRLDADVGRHA